MSKLELFREKLDGLVHFYQRAEVNLDEFRNLFYFNQEFAEQKSAEHILKRGIHVGK